ncbi:MAG: septal ring lytic transglycosylase RlpA family protein [Acidimicrobiales bacterium]
MSPEKGGPLRTHDSRTGRVALALIFSGALLVLPLVLLAGPSSGTTAVRRSRADHARPPVSARWLPMPASELAAFATLTAPTEPIPPTTTTTTTTTPTTTTPTTTPTTPTPPAATPGGTPPPSLAGGATWYPEAASGTCASPTLPFGTTVQVVNDATGASTTCVVDDREAFNPGRVVDMSDTGFSQIATPGQGVVTVTISW